jgi:protein TonB
MFEGTLVESRGLVVSGTQRWTALGSLTIQLAVAGLLLAIPLVRPEVLPVLGVAPQVQLPLPVKPPVRVVPVRTASGPSSAMSVPAAAAPPVAATQQFVFPRPGTAVDPGAPVSTLPFGMGQTGTTILAALSTVGDGPGSGVAVVRERPGLTKVSGGVTAGLLLAPIRPVYPAIAKAVGMQGAVVMEAVISKTGRIESLRVTSGPAMLREAAKTAVEAARYRPYLLSGEPTDVQTTITVVFKLGS